MNDEYYTIPFDVTLFFQSTQSDNTAVRSGRSNSNKLRCSLSESIRQNISLIITTKYGDFRFDPFFGCQIWEEDFVVPHNIDTWKDEIKVFLYNAISSNEPRIENIDPLEVEVDRSPAHNRTRIHQKLNIYLEASIKGTNERVTFSEVLFFSPYSLI